MVEELFLLQKPMDSSDIHRILLLKRVIYILENDIGSLEERCSWVQRIIKDIPDLIILLSSFKQKIETFCELYNISTKNLNEQLSFNKKVKTDKLLIEKILKNYYSGILTKHNIMSDEETHYNPHYYYSAMENVLIMTVLCHDFKSIPELEYKIESNFDNPDHFYPIDETDYNLRLETLNTVRRIRSYICCPLFLQGQYLDVVQKVFYFNSIDNEFLNISQWNSCNNLFYQDEFYSLVLISALLAIPLNKCKIFTQSTDVQFLFNNFPLAKVMIDLLINTNFKKFFNIWTKKLYPIVQRNFVVGPTLDNIEQKMRIKVYVFYFSISNRIQVSHLSDSLGIEYNIVVNDLTKLFNERKLNFVMEGDTIFYKKRSILTDISKILKSNEDKISKLLQSQNEDDHLDL